MMSSSFPSFLLFFSLSSFLSFLIKPSNQILYIWDYVYIVRHNEKYSIKPIRLKANIKSGLAGEREYEIREKSNIQNSLNHLTQNLQICTFIGIGKKNKRLLRLVVGLWIIFIIFCYLFYFLSLLTEMGMQSIIARNEIHFEAKGEISASSPFYPQGHCTSLVTVPLPGLQIAPAGDVIGA